VVRNVPVRLNHQLTARDQYRIEERYTIPAGAEIMIVGPHDAAPESESMVQWNGRKLVVDKETLETFAE
jgi:hypothetical protein